MKQFSFCFILCSFFISCNTSSEEGFTGSTQRLAGTTLDTIPISPTNPYDATGQVYYELLTAYYQGELRPFTLTGIITQSTEIANATPSFLALTKGVPYVFTASDRVASIVSQPEACLATTIDATLNTTAAKSSLTDFVGSLLSLTAKEDTYDPIYTYIVAYEDSVLRSATFTERDKKIILTTASIARHTVYAKKKKPKKNTDPDWTLLVGNITAAIDGAGVSSEEAIMRALVTGIVENT
ncbi:hypothetical protein [Flavobacterium sp. XGLA_31]|uniref:hypothetical protein n=1 Tax=Flavobacterium sp. XGLA_31 TaxID=3447666 RepID=UPI003F40D6F3